MTRLTKLLTVLMGGALLTVCIGAGTMHQQQTSLTISAEQVCLAQAALPEQVSVQYDITAQNAVTNGVYHTVCRNLLPQTYYSFAVVKNPQALDLLADENVLYVDQGMTDGEGTVTFDYIPRNSGTGTPYVFGASADEADSMTWYMTEDTTLHLAGTTVFPPDNNGTVTEIVVEAGAKALEGGVWSIPSLQKVTLPSTLTKIGSQAFRNCTYLSSVTIPDSVVSIGSAAFSNCPRLTIYGEKGSQAEQYANTNGIAFQAIGVSALENLSTLSTQTLTLGKSLTISGAASGGTSPYRYTAYYKKASSSSYTKIRGYDTNPTMTVKPAAATTYDVRVKVKDANGTIATKDFTVTVKAAALSNRSTLSTATLTLGQTLTISGAASGGTSPYRYTAYYKKASSSSYTKIRGYDANPTMTVKPAAATTYDVRVKVKDANGTIATKDFTVTVKAAALSNRSTLSTATLTLGQTLTISGAASGGTSPYRYTAYYKKASSSSYIKIRGYDTNPTMTVKPAAATTYDVRVKVKDANGTIATKDFTVIVEQPLSNLTMLSSYQLAPGQVLTIYGSASGGTRPYYYSAYYKKASSSSYTKICGYSTTSIMTVTPGAVTDYDVRVKVKDANGTIATKDFTVTVSHAMQCTTSLSSYELRVGEVLTVSCQAFGGEAPYHYGMEYQLVSAVENGDNYIEVYPYSEAYPYGKKSVMSMTFDKPGTYYVCAKVKDSGVTTYTARYTVTVTA